jgi:hypothetical protein
MRRPVRLAKRLAGGGRNDHGLLLAAENQKVCRSN